MNQQVLANAQGAKSKWTKRQRQIAQQLDPGVQGGDWQDWQWQLQHSVRDIESLERVLENRFGRERATRTGTDSRHVSHGDYAVLFLPDRQTDVS